MIKSFLAKVFILSLLPLLACASPPSWKIIPGESTLTFTGIQNGAPATGKFTHFTGEISFDPAALNASSVKIIVDTTSVSASYKDMVDTLKTADWFNVKLFPQAIFTASQFRKTGDKSYEAMGNLTIRDKTNPVTITFNVLEQSDNRAKVKGSTTIKRNAFGVGQGEWSSTDAVRNEVTVDFVLSVEK